MTIRRSPYHLPAGRPPGSAGGYLLDICDPYLTQIVFADSLEVCEKNGSSGRTRTYNPPVNSRMLCH